MAASIPGPGGDGYGGGAPELGPALLDRALAGTSGRAALLLVTGAPAAVVAAAVSPTLRRADLAVELAVDRVAVLAPHLRETSGAADLAARVLASLPTEAAAEAAIGIALAPEDGETWGALLAAAGVASGRASAYASGRFAFSDAARDALHRIGPLLAGAVAEALAEDQFRLVFQPIARLEDRIEVGVEALLRWPRPGGEHWPPDIFIREAERRGLIEPITAWTLDAACRQIRALPDVAPRNFRIGVNLSATQLGRGAAEMVAGVLKSTGADPARLTLEVTETAPFIDDAAAVRDVERIKALGCGVAIDDFGAGHASLAYVAKLPADRIKLDASLIRAAVFDARARAAVAATVRLAHDVGADVVAEGVATAGDAATVEALGVRLAQGGLIGPPREAPFDPGGERPLSLDRPDGAA